MNRRYTPSFFLAGILLSLLLLAAPALGSGAGDALSQTWPSRTPTSSSPPQPPSPPGSEPPPGQTVVATVEPGATPVAPVGSPATSAPGATGSTGGSGGAVQPETESVRLPSAIEVGDCGLPPMAVALGPVNVRSGPGIDFEVIAVMEFQDERPIIGRAAMAAWWQILLSASQLGWVSDQAVTVVGYIGVVPVTDEGNGDGSQPPWNPTPNPACRPPSQEEILISDGQLAAVLSADGPPPIAEDEATPEPDRAVQDGEVLTPEFTPLNPEARTTGFNLVWLLIVGALLIVAGAVALLAQRRQT